jgi:hypothetical protein
MQEVFIHYLWKFRLYDHADLCTVGGQRILVQEPGMTNRNAGPDFFTARVQLDDTLWAGNVEIHLKSSDWKRHGHSSDPAYGNVILHVVYEYDIPVYRSDGSLIPTLELRDRIDLKQYDNYLALLANMHYIPCEKQARLVEPVIWSSWLLRMAIERFEERAVPLIQRLVHRQYDWEQVFYECLAGNFGFHVNREPFEQVASLTSFRLLLKHHDRLFSIEALLFGQAGLLNRHVKDEYPRQLRKEYLFLRRKYGLVPIDMQRWKFMRLRPANFPSLRMAQFAALIHHSSHLFSKVLETGTKEELKKLFMPEVSSYWHTHFRFDKASVVSVKTLGESAVGNILVNTVCLFLFLYGQHKKQEDYVKKSLDLLEEIPAEDNRVIRRFADFGIRPENALQSQALLHLKSRYCDRKRCLECAVGINLVRNNAESI